MTIPPTFPVFFNPGFNLDRLESKVLPKLIAPGKRVSTPSPGMLIDETLGET